MFPSSGFNLGDGLPRPVTVGSSVFALLALGLWWAAEVRAVADYGVSGSAGARSQGQKPGLAPAPPIIPGRLVIKYRDAEQAGAPRDYQAARNVDTLLERYTGGAAVSRRPLLPGVDPARATGRRREQLRERVRRRRAHGLAGIELVRVPIATDVPALCRGLTALPEVAYAHPDYLFSLDLVPDDPYYHSANSWGQGYDDLYGPKLLDCEAAWDLSQGQGVVVAVVDSGVDYTHADLAANMWINGPEDINGNGRFDNWPVSELQEGVSGDLDGVDNDVNGYVDDVIGYDFAGDGDTADADPMDTLGHGTHVAGTIAAVGNNSQGIIGVAPQAEIMVVKIGPDGTSGVSVFAATEAVVYLADNGARVSNSSWGGFIDVPELRAAFEYAADAEVVNVASAGNADRHAVFFFPVSYETTVAVAATDHNDVKAPFSNYGRVIDLSAPGGGESEPEGLDRPDYSVLSLLAEGSVLAGGPYVVGDRYLRLGGTSMASPHVAGVAALLGSMFPEAGRQEIRGRLKGGAEPMDELNPDYAGLLGAGRVNAHQSLTAEPWPYLELVGREVQGSVVPGGSFDLVVSVINEWVAAHNTLLVLSSPNPLVDILRSEAQVGDIAGGQTVDNAQEPFEIQLDAGLSWGQTLVFELTCQFDEGLAEFSFDLAVQVFQNVISETGLPVTGASSLTLRMQDLDGDEYPDVLVPWALGTFTFFANERHGSFVPVPLPLEVHSVGGLNMVDLDDDGLSDIVAPGNVVDESLRAHIFRHRGNRQFEVAPPDDDLEDLPGVHTLALDFNKDRLVDLLFLGNTAVLLRNDGGFFFSNDSDRLPGAPICTGASVDAVLADYDNDNHPDIIVAGGAEVGLKLLRNRGDGTYEDATLGADVPFIRAWDLAVGDFDNDGLADIFAGDYRAGEYDGTEPANRLLHNNGDGTFAEITDQAGDIYQTDPNNRPAAYRGSECFDYDNDGDLDIFVQCGDNNTEPSARLYRNNGDGTFSDVTDEMITLPTGVRYTAAYGDYDCDGDIDIYLSDSVYGAAGFYRNHATSMPSPNHWIKIKLFGMESNREAFGARVTVRTGALSQIRDVTVSDRATQPLHFGLGPYGHVDAVLVRWPSGMVQHHTDIAADRTITLVEGQVAACGDIDGDGDVDLSDFATFALCYRGRGETNRPPGCPEDGWIWSDCDGDGDVDLTDFATFAATFSGEYGILDCNANLIPDACDLDCGSAGGDCDLPGCGQSGDCNTNEVPDECEPDEDCNGNGIQDICDLAGGTSEDGNANGVPDECEVPLRFVKADAPEGGNGLSWSTAYTDLQEALEVAAAWGSVVSEIWVAAGTYRPDRGTAERTASFQLINGVAIYGGFAGDEEPGTFGLADRDFEANQTILSGDLGQNDGPDRANNEENSFHLVLGTGTDAVAVLDGFTITGGNADGSEADHHNRGGGMYNDGGSPTLANCIFRENAAVYGGGMYNHGGAATLLDCSFVGNSADQGGGMYNYNRGSVTLTECTFSGNSADEGGGMRNWKSSPTLAGCTFSGNSAEYGGGMYNLRSNSPTLIDCHFGGNSAWGHGGGMYNEYDNTPVLTNCRFSGNSTPGNGGGIYNVNSNTLALSNCSFAANSAQGSGGGMHNHYKNSATLVNCTFAANAAANGRALACDTYPYFAANTLELANCILWDGGGEVWNNDGSAIAITYSDVQGFWPGEGNIEADPWFDDPTAGDYHLSYGSPCIDAGDNTVVPADDADLDGDGDESEPLPFDLGAEPRFVDDPATFDTGNCGSPCVLPVVDLGAYEYQWADCNGNSINDVQDLAEGTSQDCNDNGVPDECEPQVDCNGNGIQDICDIAAGTSPDCNDNLVPDECDTAEGTSRDDNEDGVPDECEDCNGNEVPDVWEAPVVLFDNTGGQSGVLDTPAPVAQDVHLSARAWLDEFAVCYSSTGSSPGSMMVRFFDGGADGSAVPLYPEGLIEEYNLGQLSWTGSGSACKTTDLLPPLLIPSHIWMEVEIDQNAGVVLGGAPAEVGFTQGLVYDRDAGQMLSGPLYLSFTLLGVVCFDDCNANGLQDACDLSCGPIGGPCDLPGCGQSADGNGNDVPDECESAGPSGDGQVDFDESARFRSAPRG